VTGRPGIVGFAAIRCHGDVDGDDELRATFRATLGELYAFVARRVGGERAVAEDVVQETWLRAVAAWRSGGAPREPIAWLKTTARRLVANHFRSRRSRPSVPLEQANGTAAAATDHAPEASDAAALLQRGLARLRDGEAALIEAFHLDGRSTRELAHELRTTERAVEGRLHRARHKLRGALEAAGADDPWLERLLPRDGAIRGEAR
jgi:RNA polymerase sigma-70 factor (ECF subfamily)